MKMLFLFLVIISLTVMNFNSPPILVALILTQAVIICLSSFTALKLSWLSLILYLIFLGGLMVLFIYITSLASNEALALDLNKSINFLTASGLLILSTPLIFKNTQPAFFSLTAKTKILTNIMTINFMPLIIMMILYLLLTLIVVVKISNKLNAPIKNII